MNVCFLPPYYATQLRVLTFSEVASQNAHLWGGWNLGLGPCLKSHEFYWLQQWPSWNYKVNKAQIPPPSWGPSRETNLAKSQTLSDSAETPGPSPPPSKVRHIFKKYFYCLFELYSLCLLFGDELVFFPPKYPKKKLRVI